MDSGHSGHHGGHNLPMPPMDDMPMCSMSMLWNNNVEDVCVVFSSWHIKGWLTMAISCVAVMVISILYASLLHYMKRFDTSIAYALHNADKGGTAAARRESRPGSLIPPIPNSYQTVEGGSGGGSRAGVVKLSGHVRLMRAGMYALSVAISFWLMLVAMTYNTYLFLSIVIGAFVGHVMYEGEMDVGSVLNGAFGKGLACH